MLFFFIVALVFPISTTEAGSGEEVDLSKLNGVIEQGNVLNASEIADWEKKTKTGLIPGTWYVGKTPPNVDESKPPILFVSGLTSNALTFIDEKGSMYDVAYEKGYRTAFVQLNDAAGSSFAASQWANGEILAEQIKEIYEYYGEKINVVAHSKGGIDTQTALNYYDADDYVNHVVTLSTPHYGSNLANLSYSWYASWLADLIGQQTDGTYSLQTGEMDKFRQQTDNLESVYNNQFYTVAGKGWGKFGSSLWLGGSYLWAYGSNDGAVNVWSAKLPYGTHLHTGKKLNHNTVKNGDAVFSKIESVLSQPSTKQVAVLKSLASAAISTTNQTKSFMSNTNQTESFMSEGPEAQKDEQYIQGGQLRKKKWLTKEVAVQTGITEANFSILTKHNAKVVLISPSGKKYTKRSSAYQSGEAGDVFKGARLQAFKIVNPEAGTWYVKIKNQVQKKDAYLLIVNFQGEDTTKVSIQNQPNQEEVPVEVELKDAVDYDLDTIKVKMKVINPDGKRANKVLKNTDYINLEKKSKKGKKSNFTGKFNKKNKSGVYNITTEVEGKLKNGKAFKRTVVESVYIDN
nr:hypothetical protein [Polycladospora coralii]